MKRVEGSKRMMVLLEESGGWRRWAVTAPGGKRQRCPRSARRPPHPGSGRSRARPRSRRGCHTERLSPRRHGMSRSVGQGLAMVGAGDGADVEGEGRVRLDQGRVVREEPRLVAEHAALEIVEPLRVIL